MKSPSSGTAPMRPCGLVFTDSSLLSLDRSYLTTDRSDNRSYLSPLSPLQPFISANNKILNHPLLALTNQPRTLQITRAPQPRTNTPATVTFTEVRLFIGTRSEVRRSAAEELRGRRDGTDRGTEIEGLVRVKVEGHCYTEYCNICRFFVCLSCMFLVSCLVQSDVEPILLSTPILPQYYYTNIILI